MLKDITNQDLKIVSLFTRDYAVSYSINQITTKLKLNYSHTFNRIKTLVKRNLLKLEKEGQSNRITINLKNLDTVRLLEFVEQQEVKSLNNSSLDLISKEALLIDPFCCIGLFGSRISGKASKDSDWDIFIVSQKEKKRELNKILSKLPYLDNIHVLVFSIEEFQDSLVSSEETVVKHIIRNKLIVYNPSPFYNLIYNFERIKYAPSQTD
ncbi:MAG: nucleotidyltransferase domain-containing protein [Candidatus Woesearchaeota archaeon]